jgi:RNA polymerase sigma-70 factor (sigma-E family)
LFGRVVLDRLGEDACKVSGHLDVFNAVDSELERAFTEFVAERTHALFRMAYALTGNQHAAEDLLQTALAKTFARWTRISGDAEQYVRRVLYNDSVSIWRWRSRRPETSVPSVPERPDTDTADDTVLRLVLRDALLSLPPRQRAVIVLRYLDDLDEKQVAEIMGCSPGTVASQASRALARLRRTVAPHPFLEEVPS